MQFSKLLYVLDLYEDEDISEVELRVIIYRTLSVRPTLTMVTPRFKSFNDAELWLVKKGYDPQYHTVFNDSDDYDHYLAGSRIYYSYQDKKYFDEYLNLLSRLKDMSPEEESQFCECIERIWMIAITEKRKIVLI